MTFLLWTADSRDAGLIRLTGHQSLGSGAHPSAKHEADSKSQKGPSIYTSYLFRLPTVYLLLQMLQGKQASGLNRILIRDRSGR